MKKIIKLYTNKSTDIFKAFGKLETSNIYEK